jgi:phosphate acetyltransferase
MARTLLVVPTGPAVGLTSTCLGLLRALDRLGVRVGFLKPLGESRAGDGRDRSTALVRATTRLDPPDPIPAERLEQHLVAGELDVVLEDVVAAWQPILDSSDVVVVEALNPGRSALYSTRVNAALAKALDADVLLVGSWPTAHDGQSVTQPIERLAEALAIPGQAYRTGEQARVLGAVVSRIPDDPDLISQVRGVLAERGLRLVGAVPYRPELTWPRVSDVVSEIGARVLSPGELSRRVRDVAIFAQAVPGGLQVLTDGRLVLVPGDRNDVLMAACLAALNGTRLAALLCTVGIEPDPQVWELTHAARDTGLPILLADDFTYETATAVHALNPEIPVDDVDRAEAVTTTVADGLDRAWLATLPDSAEIRRLSPAAFRYRLVELSRAAEARIVLPEGTEPRTMNAAAEAAERRIARPVLLAAPDRVAAQARSLGIRLPDGVSIVDPAAIAEKYVPRLVQLRRHRGTTEEMAREQLGDPIMVGTMMLEQGDVDGLVAGAEHTTAQTVRPALQIIRTKPGARLVSSVFFMCLPDEVVVYGDCAINPNPNAEELADIAIQSAESARAFGIEPRVAMISFSTGTSGSGTDVQKVAEATRLARERAPDLMIDGPLQYDAAAVASVGRSKAPGSEVAGRATVFIFPDLDTGNTTYKAVQRSADVVSIGPMLQGLAKPVNDVSRGALVEDIVYTIALTAIQSRAT